ncbi:MULTISPECIES: succinate dehydrogenase, cytochrome b556 subunit [Azorhizobium]|jgi:succinate dehydrogenase / fumarate reductase cytochrome b subunit|uniref:Succinate dehydrogenase cytochrome b556 subunit n=1 Tax=Azorhizobium caulinodans (strain ATCC 43989 / DSM 5975 / JCM 20966 / LMG 6465 / NBRC 14845 / NCIMB 13405 / ORS 571) TaxID=438753 RepID=A8INF0_AZOC5|nr:MULTISPECIES: succinate dehydrogenase, cytochrome b556 subunit [Azorhizobium]TDU00952.1 succinate dehydrogenase subunit C [Azorhizobium sp. AG788]BAF89741.1 succinate dehydrogenase cytochrome b-556 subunit [Azorhizobium caulinodans ORS 571]
MADSPSRIVRPLSPHLQIYRPLPTMVMSIVHRATGIALYFGTVLLIWWLLAAASTPSAYGLFTSIAGSWIGRLVLFGYTWALIHHALGGIRHLIWDTIRGFGAQERVLLAKLTLVGSVTLTIIVWVIGLALKS